MSFKMFFNDTSMSFKRLLSVGPAYKMFVCILFPSRLQYDLCNNIGRTAKITELLICSLLESSLFSAVLCSKNSHRHSYIPVYVEPRIREIKYHLRIKREKLDFVHFRFHMANKNIFKLMEGTISSISSVTNHQPIRCHVRGEGKAVETSDYLSLIV